MKKIKLKEDFNTNFRTSKGSVNEEFFILLKFFHKKERMIPILMLVPVLHARKIQGED